MRGLKYQDIAELRQRQRVALYMSAWIEIISVPSNASAITVALYMSAWIEMLYIVETYLFIIVALYMSAWIEIVNYVKK